MKNRRVGYLFLATILGVAMLGCHSSPERVENRDVLFQYSTLGSLLAGVYDGEMTCSELKKQGDLGLGTFNALDGEMIEVDHQIYQIKSDGVAYQVNGQMKIPFAVATYFEPDQTVTIDETMTYEQMKAYVDSVLPTENIPYAIRIDGTFDYVKTRSVPRQNKPYPRLLEVLKVQPTFEFHDIEGVMVGFRLPGYMEGANAPGYHLHFITRDRKAGGHVLQCRLHDINVEIDHTSEWYAVFPDDDAFYDVKMTGDQYQ